MYVQNEAQKKREMSTISLSALQCPQKDDQLIVIASIFYVLVTVCILYA